MPSVSRAQQIAMAIAEHHPSEVSSKNKGVLSMSHSQLHDFAATKQGPKMPKHVEHVHEHLNTPSVAPHKGVTVTGEAHTGPVAGSMPAHKHDKVTHFYKK